CMSGRTSPPPGRASTRRAASSTRRWATARTCGRTRSSRTCCSAACRGCWATSTSRFPRTSTRPRPRRRNCQEVNRLAPLSPVLRGGSGGWGRCLLFRETVNHPALLLHNGETTMTHKLFALGLPLAVALALLAPASADDKKADKKDEGWIQLFNGKDLTGWK